MKISLFSVGAFAIALTSLATAWSALPLPTSPATPAPTVDDEDPPEPTPNRECGSEPSTHETEEEVCGEGDSEGAAYRAEREAREKLDIALGQDSGVVCDICPTGIQCERSVVILGEPDCPPADKNPHTGEWEAECCYTGEYSVWCKPCPEE